MSIQLKHIDDQIIGQDICSPICDNFESIVSEIACDQVDKWDITSTISYAKDQLQKNHLTGLGVDELFDLYEDQFKRSILHEINDWKIPISEWGNYNWIQYFVCVDCGVSNGKPQIRLYDPLNFDYRYNGSAFWAIYLLDNSGQKTCLIELANQEEAELIFELIKSEHFS